MQVEKEKRKIEVEGGTKATIDFSSEEILSFDRKIDKFSSIIRCSVNFLFKIDEDCFRILVAYVVLLCLTFYFFPNATPILLNCDRKIRKTRRKARCVSQLQNYWYNLDGADTINKIVGRNLKLPVLATNLHIMNEIKKFRANCRL